MEQKDLLSPIPNYGTPQNLPNATTALVLGIVSIVGSLCYGIIGLICGIIGLVIANKDRKLYQSAPDLYSSSSLSTSNAGRICSIVGISLSLLLIILIIIAFVVFGSLYSGSFR